MQLLILLLAFLASAVAKCPDFMPDIPPNATVVHRLAEAADVACGRANYTSVFWSRYFYEQLIVNMVTKAHGTDHPLMPLFDRLQAKFDSLEGPEATDDQLDAKDIIDSMFERYQKMLSRTEKTEEKTEEKRDENPGAGLGEIFQSMIGPLMTIFTPANSIVLMQTMKDGFGVVETAEMRRERVDTAMNAFERVGLDDENMGELFARLYVIATEPMALRRLAFDQFAEWTEKQWNSTEIGPLEILPGIEVLYLQYQHLTDKKAKIFVNWILASHATLSPSVNCNVTQMDEKDAQMGFAALMMPGLAPIESQRAVEEKLRSAMETRGSQFEAICPSKSITPCFEALPIDARKELVETFPELFSYLNRNYGYEAPIGQPIPIMNNEIDGSGEGSGEGFGEGSGQN